MFLKNLLAIEELDEVVHLCDKLPPYLRFIITNLFQLFNSLISTIVSFYDTLACIDRKFQSFSISVFNVL